MQNNTKNIIKNIFLTIFIFTFILLPYPKNGKFLKVQEANASATPPDTPTNSSPADSATDVSLTPTLTASSFSHSEDDDVTTSNSIFDRVGTNNLTATNMSGSNILTVSNGVSNKSLDFTGSTDQTYTIANNTTWGNQTGTGGKAMAIWFTRSADQASPSSARYMVGRSGTGSSNAFFGVGTRRHVSFTGARLDLTTRISNGGTVYGINGSTELELDKQYMAIFQTNGSKSEMYLGYDGTLHTETVGNWSGGTDLGHWFGNNTSSGTRISVIGSNLTSGVTANTAYHEGEIDNVVFFNDDLTPSERTELYNGGAAIDPTAASFASKVTSYYPLGEAIVHQASQWQISDTSADYSSPVYDSGTDASNLTSVTVPGSTLDSNTTYYWRVRYQDEFDNWSGWSTETSFTTESGGALSVDIVDSGDASVVSPSISMNSTDFSFSDQNTTGVFGVADQKIRVTNPTGGDIWTVSLAATGGSTDFWDGTTSDYDFNDSTASAVDGADADALGGQMTIDPSSITITPEGGCASTNISGGSSNSFEEGVTDSITLASAASGADTSCFWDLTGIDVSQTIPAEQSADSYNIEMTLSIIAS